MKIPGPFAFFDKTIIKRKLKCEFYTFYLYFCVDFIISINYAIEKI